MIWLPYATVVLLPGALAQWSPETARLRLRPLLMALTIGGLVAIGALSAKVSTASLERPWPEAQGRAIAQAAATDPSLRVVSEAGYGDWLLWRFPELQGRIAFDIRFELLGARGPEDVAHFQGASGPTWKRPFAGYRLALWDADENPEVVQALRAERGSRVLASGDGAYAICARTYREGVSTNNPEHEPVFPEPRSAPEPPGYDGRPIHPQSSLRMWARRIGGPLIAAVVIGFQWILKLKFVIFAIAKFGFVTTALTGVLDRRVHAAVGLAVRGAVRAAAVRARARPCAVDEEGGIPAGAPGVHPVPGAVIAMRGIPRNAYVEAKIGLAGPVLGTLGAAVVLGLGELQDSDLLRAAASTGFLLNLFNLLPIVPLDGGRAMAAIHPSLWIAGLAGLAVLLVFSPNVILVLILLLGGREAWVRWRSRNDTAGAAYYAIARSQRIAIGVLYIGLAVVCVLGMRAGYVNT